MLEKIQIRTNRILPMHSWKCSNEISRGCLCSFFRLPVARNLYNIRMVALVEQQVCFQHRQCLVVDIEGSSQLPQVSQKEKRQRRSKQPSTPFRYLIGIIRLLFGDWQLGLVVFLIVKQLQPVKHTSVANYLSRIHFV